MLGLISLGMYSYEILKYNLILQVLSAKVVTNARSPGAKCYGIVTMSSSTEVSRCIAHLHRTELHGQLISVEKVSVTICL